MFKELGIGIAWKKSSDVIDPNGLELSRFYEYAFLRIFLSLLINLLNNKKKFNSLWLYVTFKPFWNSVSPATDSSILSSAVPFTALNLSLSFLISDGFCTGIFSGLVDSYESSHSV